MGGNMTIETEHDLHELKVIGKIVAITLKHMMDNNTETYDGAC
jgi:hypothetical protein